MTVGLTWSVVVGAAPVAMAGAVGWGRKEEEATEETLEGSRPAVARREGSAALAAVLL